MIRLGLVGVGGRGTHFKTACRAHPEIQIEAICDLDPQRAERAFQLLGAKQKFTDYERMLQTANLDAVVIGTPVSLHVSQSIAALNLGLHVLSEVPAGSSLEECRQLVLAARRSSGMYMLAENCNYLRENMLVRELVRKGLFGATYFAEGEYIHELKDLSESTPWRRKWHTGINGNTYPTHSLGPILQWMPGDRIVSVCCAGSGHHYKDPHGREYENEDTTITLCKMRHGGLIKLRLDMLSDRPEAINTYQLQGRDGCYESGRVKGESGRIWLRSHSKDAHTWIKPAELEQEFLPEVWKQADPLIQKTGHSGSDHLVLMDFIDAILSQRTPSIDIDEAMDMTLPGLVSQQSIANNSQWIDVPDSRDWRDEPKAASSLHHLEIVD